MTNETEWLVCDTLIVVLFACVMALIWAGLL